MKSFKIITGETYSCSKCNKDFTDEVFEFEDWRCPECNRRITISVQRKKLPPMLLERKHIDDVVENDDVFLSETYSLHEVLGKKEMSRGKIKLSLRNFGSINYNEDDYVDCRANFGHFDE